MNSNFLLNSFPNDDVIRVLTLYGGIENNFSGNSSSPLIYVLLWEVDINKKSLIEDNFIISTICLNQLYKAKIGSIWKGQKYISQNFNFSNTICSLKLNFLFKFNKPKVENLETLIKFDLININFFEKLVAKKILNKDSELFHIFLKSYYCDLITVTGKRVFISCMVLLQAFFTKNSFIKNDILIHSREKIINKYFYLNFDCSYNYIYVIRDSYKKLGNQSINFLKSITYNPKVQEVISVLQMSLEDTIFSPHNKYSKIRHPIITPPYINDLGLTIKGIWIKKNEIFLITKIQSFNSIDNFL